MNRRKFLAATAVALASSARGGDAVLGLVSAESTEPSAEDSPKENGSDDSTRGEEKAMYGLIGKIDVVPGKREELAAILLAGISGMPGCLSYVVAKDASDENGLWVTEVWDSKESHQGSLALDSVREAITKGRPLIAGFSERFETVPLGGQGLGGTADS